MMRPRSPHSGHSEKEQAPPRLRKPLYIDGAHVRLLALEGPALRLEDDLGRQRYYPLARLSRIVWRGHFLCETQALEALLEAGLSITIIGQENAALGWLASASPLLLTSLQQRLEELEGLGLLHQVLEDWRLSRLRMMILRHIVPHLPGTHPADLRARTMRSRANTLIYRDKGLEWRKIMRRYRGLMRALTLQYLQEAGVDASWLGAEPTRPDLGGLLAGLLEWVLWGAALRHRKLSLLKGWKGEIAFFEAQRDRLDQEARTLLADLERNLQDAIFNLRGSS